MFLTTLETLAQQEIQKVFCYFRIKWEALKDKEVRKQFESSISYKFRQLPGASDEIEKEWLLFRSVIISSAAGYCGRKWLMVAGIVRKGHLGRTKKLKKLFEQIKMRSGRQYFAAAYTRFSMFCCLLHISYQSTV